MPIVKEDLLPAYRELCKKYSFPEKLKEEQLEITLSLLNNSHTFGVLPTGYGKSLCFGLPPLIQDMVSHVLYSQVSIDAERKRGRLI